MLRPVIAITFLVASFAHAGDTPGSESAETRGSGPISLKFASAQFRAPVVAELGKDLRAPCYAGVIDFLGSHAISFGPLVQNPTKRPIYYAFYFALFDEQDHLVAAGGGWKNRPLRPGERNDAGFCMVVTIPRGTEDSVKRFQAVLYESEAPIGAMPVSSTAVIADWKWAEKRNENDPYHPIDLKSLKGDSTAAPVVAAIGSGVTFDGRYHSYDQEKGQWIWGGGTLTNKSKSPMHFSYGVAFMDVRGILIGAAGDDVGTLDPREQRELRLPIAVPKELAVKVHCFDAVLYESKDNFPHR